MDPELGRAVLCRRRRFGAADGPAHGGSRAAGLARVLAHRAASASLLRPGALSPSRPVRNLHRAELLPLVLVLGAEPGPGIFPHPALGRSSTEHRRDSILRL